MVKRNTCAVLSNLMTERPCNRYFSKMCPLPFLRTAGMSLNNFDDKVLNGSTGTHRDNSFWIWKSFCEGNSTERHPWKSCSICDLIEMAQLDAAFMQRKLLSIIVSWKVNVKKVIYVCSTVFLIYFSSQRGHKSLRAFSVSDVTLMTVERKLNDEHKIKLWIRNKDIIIRWGNQIRECTVGWTHNFENGS